MAGLAVAFPLSIGIALVVGVVLAYIRQPKGDLAFLSAGVLCAVIAVILIGKAYGSLAGAGIIISKKSVVTCIVSGVLMGLWAPAVTYAMTNGKAEGRALGPYGVAVFLTLGALLSCFVWNTYFMKHPLVGEPVKFSGFFRGPIAGHLLGLFGGVIWGVGMVFNLVAADFTGVARSYAIGQSAPMVAALWGIFAWKEFKGGGSKATMYLILMFVFYGLAIALVAKANG